jgi:hypothetical protein
MQLKTPLILFILLLAQGLCYGQNMTVTISGMVKDQSTGTALPFVNVVVKTGKDSQSRHLRSAAA